MSYSNAAYSTTPLLDQDQLTMLTSALGEEINEVMDELIELFAQDGPQLIGKITDLCGKNLKSDAARAAHALAGCAANLGALKLRTASKFLEHNLPTLDESTQDAVLADLRSLHEESLNALRKFAEDLQDQG